MGRFDNSRKIIARNQKLINDTASKSMPEEPMEKHKFANTPIGDIIRSSILREKNMANAIKDWYQDKRREEYYPSDFTNASNIFFDASQLALSPWIMSPRAIRPGIDIGKSFLRRSNLKPGIGYDKYYHYSSNDHMQFGELDLFRKGVSQSTKNMPKSDPYGGFYTSKSERIRFFSSNKGRYSFKMPKDVKIADLAKEGRATDRIQVSELRKLSNEFDVIKGKNMLGIEEWIPLNYNKMYGWSHDFSTIDPNLYVKQLLEIPSYQTGGMVGDNIIKK